MALPPKRQIPKVSIAEWHENLSKYEKQCSNIRNRAVDSRKDGRIFMEQTNIDIDWNLQENVQNLKERILEMTKWKEEIMRQINMAEAELSCLESEKDITEKKIVTLNENFDTVNTCLSLRNEGKKTDLCADDVEKQLQRELNVLGILRKRLSDSGIEALQQMMQLSKTINVLKADVELKTEALKVESLTLEHAESLELMPDYKPSIGLHLNYRSYESWIYNCQKLLDQIEEELQNTRKLSKDMLVPREQAQHEISAQTEKTNFAIRKRIHEFETALDQLQWQRQNLLQESENVIGEIREMEKFLEDKRKLLRVVETLEANRMERPAKELCQDKCTLSLQDQTFALEDVLKNVINKLANFKKVHEVIQEQICRTEQEISNKLHALSIEKRCLDARRNMTLVKSSNERLYNKSNTFPLGISI